MRNHHKPRNWRWPLSLYWTIMLCVPMALAMMMAGYLSAYSLVQLFLRMR